MEPPSASVWGSGEEERNSATFPSRAGVCYQDSMSRCLQLLTAVFTVDRGVLHLSMHLAAGRQRPQKKRLSLFLRTVSGPLCIVVVLSKGNHLDLFISEVITIAK